MAAATLVYLEEDERRPIPIQMPGKAADFTFFASEDVKYSEEFEVLFMGTESYSNILVRHPSLTIKATKELLEGELSEIPKRCILNASYLQAQEGFEVSLNIRFIKNLKGPTTANLPKEVESYPNASFDLSPFQSTLEGNDPHYSLKLPKDSTLEASLLYADEISF